MSIPEDETPQDAVHMLGLMLSSGEAQAEIAAGFVRIYYVSTPGAARVIFSGKDDDGTPVVGYVLLS